MNPIQQALQSANGDITNGAKFLRDKFYFGGSLGDAVNNLATPQLSGNNLISPIQGALTQNTSQPVYQQPPDAIKQAMQIIAPNAPKQVEAEQITPTRTQNPTELPGVHPAVAQNFLSLLNDHVLPVTRKFGIPDAVVAGQMAQESGYAQKPAGANNFFGLKAHSYPGFAHFDTPEDGALYYAQTVQHMVPNLKDIKDKPLEVLKALQGHTNGGNYEGDNPDPMQYVYDVSVNPAWEAFNGGTSYPKNPHGWKQ